MKNDVSAEILASFQREKDVQQNEEAQEVKKQIDEDGRRFKPHKKGHMDPTIRAAMFQNKFRR